MTSHVVYSTRAEWGPRLAALPDKLDGKLPTLFLAHGSPMLLHSPQQAASRGGPLGEVQGPTGALATFLQDLGPALLNTYKPKAIVVFSAHWETHHGQLVTDYGDNQPLLYDYYGFPKSLYEVKFSSRGDSALSSRIVELLKQANINARTTTKLEGRGEDGRGGSRPGLDHGVFVPFKHMFGDEPEIPIVEVSMNSSLEPEDEWRLGRALEPLRSEGVLIISGGLTIHNLRDFSGFSELQAKQEYKDFERAILDAAQVKDARERQQALIALVQHGGFRKAHPRAEHFVPLYVAAGAADRGQDSGEAEVLMGAHGCKTILFR